MTTLYNWIIPYCKDSQVSAHVAWMKKLLYSGMYIILAFSY